MNIAEILKLGSIGLLFLFAFLTYRLLANEQKQTEPRTKMLTPIYIFMVLTVVFGSASLYLEYSKFESSNNKNNNGSNVSATVENEIQKLTEEHNKRINSLHEKYLKAEYESTYGGNIDSYKEEYLQQAKRFAEVIKQENLDFAKKIEALRNMSTKP